MREALTLKGRYTMTHRRAGAVMGTMAFDNLITTEGRAYIAANSLADAFYIGLIGGSPTVAAGDTASSNASREIAGYDETTRPLWDKTYSAPDLTNAASVATFTMDGTDTTCGGAFVGTSATKDGTAGSLLSAGVRSGGNLTGIADGDTIEITYVLTLG